MLARASTLDHLRYGNATATHRRGQLQRVVETLFVLRRSEPPCLQHMRRTVDVDQRRATDPMIELANRRRATTATPRIEHSSGPACSAALESIREQPGLLVPVLAGIWLLSIAAARSGCGQRPVGQPVLGSGQQDRARDQECSASPRQDQSRTAALDNVDSEDMVRLFNHRPASAGRR